MRVALFKRLFTKRDGAAGVRAGKVPSARERKHGKLDLTYYADSILTREGIFLRAQA